MPKRGELFKAAILENDSTQALYITCLYVIKEQFAYLEDEWIISGDYEGEIHQYSDLGVKLINLCKSDNNNEQK